MALKKFGSYEVAHELKTGGMGSVLLARRRGPGAFEQLVAIKTIKPEFASAAHVRAMFLDEAAILARINHPAIATVHDFGEEGGTLYMVMEYVAGLPFRDLAEPPPPAVAARAIVEACRGLHAAHELHDLAGHPLQLVHRDISPDNLMLGYDGHVKVIDFGIALVKKHRQAPVTELGTIKGKPPYMSPEQVANETMDRRSDVFSLAVVLWELVVGKPLFEGDSIYHVAIAVQEQPIVPPSQASGRALPAGLDGAILRALDRDLARRTPTAAQLAEELEQVIQRAGGETLEAWAARELVTQREAHRKWLASVVGGEALPRAIGRATGQVTELAPIAHADTPMAPAPAPELALEPEPGRAPEPEPGRAPEPDRARAPEPEHARAPEPDPARAPEPDAEPESQQPSSRLAPLVIVAIALLVAGAAVYLAVRPRTSRVVIQPDAQMTIRDDTAPTVLDVFVVPRLGAAVDAMVVVDAEGLRVDAGVRVITRADARVARPDAAARPDAPPPPPSGTGVVNIRFKPGIYATISIDGSPPVPGPLLNKKLSAGKHTITFHDPKLGDTLDTQVIEVAAGGTYDVRQK